MRRNVDLGRTGDHLGTRERLTLFGLQVHQAVYTNARGGQIDRRSRLSIIMVGGLLDVVIVDTNNEVAGIERQAGNGDVIGVIVR